MLCIFRHIFNFNIFCPKDVKYCKFIFIHTKIVEVMERNKKKKILILKIKPTYIQTFYLLISLYFLLEIERTYIKFTIKI